MVGLWQTSIYFSGCDGIKSRVSLLHDNTNLHRLCVGVLVGVAGLLWFGELIVGCRGPLTGVRLRLPMLCVGKGAVLVAPGVSAVHEVIFSRDSTQCVATSACQANGVVSVGHPIVRSQCCLPPSTELGFGCQCDGHASSVVYRTPWHATGCHKQASHRTPCWAYILRPFVAVPARRSWPAMGCDSVARPLANTHIHYALCAPGRVR